MPNVYRPKLMSGSYPQWLRSELAGVYTLRAEALGNASTCHILGMGDVNVTENSIESTSIVGWVNNSSATKITWTPRQNQSAVALSAWATPFNLNGPSPTVEFKMPYVSFNGSTEWIDGGDNYDMNNTDFTLSIWIRGVASQGGSWAVLAKRASGAAPGVPGWVLGNTSSSELFRGIIDDGTDTATLPGSADVSDTTWKHLAMTFNNTTGQLIGYLNGAQETQTTIAGMIAGDMSNAVDLAVGARDNAGSILTPFEGDIGGAASGPLIQQTLATPEQVKAEYQLIAPYFGITP